MALKEIGLSRKSFNFVASVTTLSHFVQFYMYFRGTPIGVGRKKFLQLSYQVMQTQGASQSISIESGVIDLASWRNVSSNLLRHFRNQLTSGQISVANDLLAEAL